MQLNYILGATGSGKTRFIYNKILDLQSKKDSNIIYIVPDQFTMISEKEFLSVLPNNTSIKTKIVSFNRLAFHVFSEIGWQNYNLLEDVGKYILIRKVIYEVRDKFNFYKKNNITKGFIEKIADSITEFYSSQIYPEDILNFSKNIDRQDIALKMQDIYLIYITYCNYLKDTYISTDDILDVLAENLDNASFLNNAIIFIDEFSGFTKQEYKVIRKLLRKCLSISVSLTIDKASIFYDNINITDTFFETKNTISKLTNIANEEKISINNIEFLKEDLRHKNNQEFTYLKNNIFNFENNNYQYIAQNINIFEGANFYKELEFVANKINCIVKNKNYKYNQIGVVVSDINLYKNAINSIFYKYNIPAFIDEKDDILSYSLVETIRALVDIIIYNYSYESIFRFLKSGLTSIPLDEIDILENYVLEYGIKGFKWFTDWKYGFNNKYNKEQINNIKIKVLKLIKPFSKNIKLGETYTVKYISNIIFNSILSINILEALNKVNENQNITNVQFLKNNQIWNKVCHVFEKMVDIIGENKVDIVEYSYILESGFLHSTISTIPPSQDMVMVADSTRSRMPSMKVIFILGVNEGIFPKIQEETGLFNTNEKLYMEQIGFKLNKNSLEQSFQSNFTIYNLLLKPEEKLFLSYSTGSLDGKSLFPSFIIDRIKKIFTIKSIYSKDICISKEVLLDNFTSILQNYNNKNLDFKNLKIYNLFKKDNKYKNIITNLENVILNKKNIVKLNSDLISKMYGKEINISISKLEKYVECPFAFFMKYNLNIKERKLYEILNVDIGEIFHNILDGFTKLLEENEEKWELLDKSKISLYTKICINNIIDNFNSDIFSTDIRTKYILERITRISENSIWALSNHIKCGEFKIFGTEVNFGGNSALNGIVIEINENYKFIFNGRVDRIDILDSNGNKFVKIIDYKTGNRKFELSDIYYGMQMQMLIYLNNILKNNDYFKVNEDHTKLLPGGILYFKVQDPIIDLNEELSKEEIEKLILQKFRMSGILLENNDVIKALDCNLNKKSDVIPVSVNSDGTYSKTSSIVEEKIFKNIMDYTIKKVKNIGSNIISGNFSPIPYKKENKNACLNCNYKSICSFDENNKKVFKYNNFNKIDLFGEIGK